MDEAISAFKAEGGKLASKQEVEMKRLKRQIRKVEKKLNTVCFFLLVFTWLLMPPNFAMKQLNSEFGMRLYVCPCRIGRNHLPFHSTNE